ncbi:MAG TPA: hypothetical protein VIM10_01780 [Actinopolymorphaceae bacterium]|jgi:hypothetical protein
MSGIGTRILHPPAWFRVIITAVCMLVLLTLIVNVFRHDTYTGPWLWVALVFAIASGALGWTYKMPSLRRKVDDGEDEDGKDAKDKPAPPVTR